MDDLGNENLPGALADIRKMERPGRRGGAFCYAGAVYACFADIQALVSEGFTLTTICKFLEKKGLLPTGADTRSFCRAYRRERSRRERPAMRKKTKAKEVSVKNDSAAKLTETTGAKQESGMTGMTGKQTPPPAEPRGGLRLNPDNTFKIEPIDLGDLPDFENLTKRRNEA
jgi:hypothetical protein